MKNENVPRSFDDLVFEHRNKLYGAYAIRRSYSDNVNKGLMIAGLAVVALAFGPRLFTGGEKAIAELPSLGKVIKTEINPFIVVTPPPVAPPRAHIRPVSQANLVPQVVTHTVVEPVDVLTGPAEPDVPVYGTGPETNVVTIVEPAVVAPEPSNSIHVIAERMPAYKGGMEAMVRYLQRQLHYPAVDRRMGVEGTVFVSFVIDKEGNVTMASVVKGISATCDEEALRVINKMPPWVPGMQSNVPVMVRMVLPIKFSLAH